MSQSNHPARPNRSLTIVGASAFGIVLVAGATWLAMRGGESRAMPAPQPVVTAQAPVAQPVPVAEAAPVDVPGGNRQGDTVRGTLVSRVSSERLTRAELAAYSGEELAAVRAEIQVRRELGLAERQVTGGDETELGTIEADNLRLIEELEKSR